MYNIRTASINRARGKGQHLLTLTLVLGSLLGSFAQTPTPSKEAPAILASFSDGSPQAEASPNSPSSSRKGNIVQLPYIPEDKQIFNPEQFGSNKYFSPNFSFSVDWNPGGKSTAYRKTLGVNRFNIWSISEAEKPAMTFGDAMAYMTESALHGELEGAGYFERNLADYEQYIWKHLPAVGYGNDAGVKLVIYDIETSIGWSPNAYQGNSHWPAWEAAKNRSVVCESDGVTRTLQQIDEAKMWETETMVRRSNRVKILMRITRAKSRPGVKISYGASLYQGLPRIDFAQGKNIFLEGKADVSHIGGSNGTIVLNGRTYTGMTSSQWEDEDLMLGYYYLFNFELQTYQDYLDIWVKKLPGTQTLPYVWSRMIPIHIVADEKGYLQLNRRLMKIRQGQTRPILRMMEPTFEGDIQGGVPGHGLLIGRLPFADLQPSVTGNGEPPKIWQPPYLNYSRYCVTRFFAGDEEGWGVHLFPVGPELITKELTSRFYHHHFHSITALYQARHDMQPYEQFFPGSILVEDPEVQEKGSGSFMAYDGVTAYNYNGGKQGPQKPAYMLRYKPIPGGWRVLLLGGMNQGYTSERTDMVRAPAGLLNGNQFKVKLRGPSAHIYEFIVKSSDSHQTYEGLPTASSSWEKPGYSGRTSSKQAQGD